MAKKSVLWFESKTRGVLRDSVDQFYCEQIYLNQRHLREELQQYMFSTIKFSLFCFYLREKEILLFWYKLLSPSALDVSEVEIPF
jgi:hypothetical protein